MVKINKETLVDISWHLQQTNEMIEYLQLELQLKRNELQEKSYASEFLNHTDKNVKPFIQTTSSVEVVQVQLSSQPIIKPWEEIQSKKN